MSGTKKDYEHGDELTSFPKEFFTTECIQRYGESLGSCFISSPSPSGPPDPKKTASDRKADNEEQLKWAYKHMNDAWISFPEDNPNETDDKGKGGGSNWETVIIKFSDYSSFKIPSNIQDKKKPKKTT